MAPNCPTYSACPSFRYPYSYRYQFNMGPNVSNIFVVAPWNDVLFHGTYQSSYPPSPTGTVTSVTGGPTIEDPYLTSLLTPTTVGTGAAAVIQRPTGRPVSCCVELCTNGAVGVLQGDVIFAPWDHGFLPNPGSLVGGTFTGYPSHFYSIYESIIELPKYKIFPTASFTTTKCMHMYMRDRSALEHTAIETGADAWEEIYFGVDPGVIGRSNVGVGVPWSPLIIYIGNPSVSAVQGWILTVRGVMEVNPPVGSAWYRMAKIPRAPKAAAESAWWKHCRKLASLGLRDVAGGPMNRSIAGVTGVKDTTTTASAPPRKRNLRRGKNVSTSTAPPSEYQPRTYRPKVPSLTNKVVNALADLAMNAAVGKVNGPPAIKLQQKAIGDLRRRRR